MGGEKGGKCGKKPAVVVARHIAAYGGRREAVVGREEGPEGRAGREGGRER